MCQKIITLSITLLIAWNVCGQTDTPSPKNYAPIANMHSNIKNYDKFWSIGVGMGSDYGNLGGKLQVKLSRGFGMSVGIGYNCFIMASEKVPFPLRYFEAKPGIGLQNAEQSVVDRMHELYQLGLPYTLKTLSGLSVAAGFDFWVWRYIYFGVYYNYFGDYYPLLDDKKTIHGFTVSPMGWIPFGKKAPISINIGGSLGFGFGGIDTFVKDFMHFESAKGRTYSLFMSLNMGISFHHFFRNYKIRYKNSLKNLEKELLIK